ncbi:MAG: hypothetical protein QOK05_1264 [Chloroflexota bacterium]|jgi:DNA-directed RNA polymerase specialized sigma24 family protein|nr:hypothetical protein [Chloroflexota bacterium]
MIALQLTDTPVDDAGTADNPEVRRVLEDLLDELPDPYADVLKMVELDGISIADSASRLELREASMRLLYREGRRRLRDVVLAHSEAGRL